MLDEPGGFSCLYRYEVNLLIADDVGLGKAVKRDWWPKNSKTDPSAAGKADFDYLSVFFAGAQKSLREEKSENKR